MQAARDKILVNQTVVIDLELRRQLLERCRQTEKSLSKCVREALEAYLEQKKEKEIS